MTRTANVLKVEGRLTRDTLEELRMTCDAMADGGEVLRVDLSGLRFVDAGGVSLLRRLERHGATLTAASGFVAASLRDGGDEPADSGDEPRARAGEPAASAEPSPESDAWLVERLRHGDAAAFETLVRRHGGRMLAVARRMVRNEDDARDVVQEAFLSAFRGIDSFAGTARVSTWLHRVVVNAALMRLRSRRRRPEEPIEALLPRFQEDGHWAESPVGFETTAEALLERRDTRAIVRRAIDRLPETYRKVIVLRDIEDLDTDEAAELLGISVNALKIRLHRARQALRTLLVEALGAEERVAG